jgi:predicted DNA-binding transcriptional regulator YafY
VYRDLEALGAAGVPVYTETGRYGGARLVDGWRTRLTGLTTEEADSLPLLGMPGAAAELGLGTVLAATQLKVLAALPPELRSRAARVQERFHLDAPGWFHRGEGVPHLATVAEAVWSDHRLAIRYQRGDKAVERTIDPLGLVLKAGTWYLVASHRGQPRTYRVSRIDAADLLEERFTRPDGFDLAERWAASSTEFERTMQNVQVRLRIREERAWLLDRALDPVARRACTTQPEGDGWLVASFAAESVEIALPQLLQLGDAAVVLEPPELRERIEGEVRRMAASYDDAAPAMASASRRASAR